MLNIFIFICKCGITDILETVSILPHSIQLDTFCACNLMCNLKYDNVRVRFRFSFITRLNIVNKRHVYIFRGNKNKYRQRERLSKSERVKGRERQEGKQSSGVCVCVP